MASDLLEITALRVKTHIGIHSWEQRILQTLLLDISLATNLKSCHDSLENTIDYAVLCNTITTRIESRSFQLIETVAEQVIIWLQELAPSSKVTVRVSKPNAIMNASNISVTLSS